MKEWRIETISFVKVVVQSPTSRNLLLDPEKVETWRNRQTLEGNSLYSDTENAPLQCPHNSGSLRMPENILQRWEPICLTRMQAQQRKVRFAPRIWTGKYWGFLKTTKQNKTTQLSHSLLRALRFTNQGPQWCVRHDLFNGWDIPCYSLAAALVRVHLPTDLVLILLSNLFSLVESILGIHVWSSYSHSFGNSRLAPLMPGRVSCSCS